MTQGVSGYFDLPGTAGYGFTGRFFYSEEYDKLSGKRKVSNTGISIQSTVYGGTWYPGGTVAVEGETLGLVDGLGGGAGAEEVGGIHRVNVDIFKAAAENIDLTVATVGNEAVILSVGNAVEVALRLGVADEIDGCHTMLTHSFRDFLALSTSSALRRV